MPLDPNAEAFLQQLQAQEVLKIHEQTVESARNAMSDRADRLFGEMDEVASIVDESVPSDFGSIPVRIYRGTQASVLPTLIFIHGGGWARGDIESYDGVCRALAKRAECQVISVGYRLAPEFKYPAGLDDCWQATLWARDNAGALGGDPRRLAVAGDGSGGNLAAVVAIRAREKRLPIAFQALIYPVTDFSFETPSYSEYADGYNLTREAMRTYWGYYLPNEAAGAEPEASPLRAPDLSRLAPALVITCEYHPLRDEGEAYAQRLKDAGVPTTLHRYDGMVHGFFRMAAVMPQGEEAIDEVAAAIRDAFGRGAKSLSRRP